MNLKDWEDYIDTLYPRQPDRFERFKVHTELLHACLGVAGESGEVIDIIKKHAAYGKPLDQGKLVDELGDLLHYIFRVMHLTGITFDRVIEGNHAKLSKRFPKGYSDSDAINKTETKT